MGLEIELNLTDEAGDPAMRQRRRCSRRSPTPTSRPSSAQFNVEINIPPRLLEGDGVHRARAAGPRRASTPPRSRSRGSGAHMMIDRDPADDLRRSTSTPSRSAPTRATRCSTSRSSPPAGRTSQISIAGAERLRRSPTRSRPRPRARACSCTSRSSPERFATLLERRAGDRRRPARGRARTRRSSSAASCGARRGSRSSSRRPTRGPEELKAQGVRPRVWFGERWITSIFDLFEENVTLLPGAAAGVRRRRTRSRCSRPAASPRSPSCACTTARSTAGTGRSTTSCAAARTCASRTACCPPARPSSTRSPTPPSTTALVKMLAEEDRPIWSRMSFSAAEENFHAGARDGIDATRVLARARRGAGVRARAAAAAAARPRRARALGRRRRRPRPPARASSSSAARRSRNGATWQAETFHRLYDDAGLDRERGAARDDGPLPRPHARQRAGPRLARGLTHS